MIKRIARVATTAFLGGALLFSGASAATASSHNGSSAKVRHDNAKEAQKHYDGSTNDWYDGEWWAPYGIGYVGYGPGYAPPPPPATWGTGYIAPGTYEYGRLMFRGFNKPPSFYFAPPGIGAEHGYYLPYLTDVFDNDYFVSYGYRCNGYRDGYYYGPDGHRWQNGGHDYFRRNADCDDFYARNGFWYGVPVCDQYDFESGYCDTK